MIVENWTQALLQGYKFSVLVYALSFAYFSWRKLNSQLQFALLLKQPILPCQSFTYLCQLISYNSSQPQLINDFHDVFPFWPLCDAVYVIMV